MPNGDGSGSPAHAARACSAAAIALTVYAAYAIDAFRPAGHACTLALVAQHRLHDDGRQEAEG